MTKIDIVSGFLGAGKTTLIKKLLKEALQGEQVVLIENEFGEIGIDGGFLKEAGVEITEMNSGCICCSLVGDFASALKQVLDQYHPDRILIEPSGVGKLSDVMRAVEGATGEAGVHLNSAVAVVDAKKCKTYLKNFGEFFENQIEHAGTIILSRTGEMSEEKINQCIGLIRQHNEKAAIITTPWDELKGTKIMEAIEGAKDLEAELLKAVMEEHEHEHHHHDHDDECCHHDMITRNMSTTMITITRNMSIIMTIITKSMNITMTTIMKNIIMIMTDTAAADMTMGMDIIMQMKYLQAGAWKHRISIQRKNYKICWMH